jgi:hypothetical protein
MENELPLRVVFCEACSQPTGEVRPWGGQGSPFGRCFNCTDIPAPAHMNAEERAMSLAGERVPLEAATRYPDGEDLENDPDMEDLREQCSSCGSMEFTAYETFTRSYFLNTSDNIPNESGFYLNPTHSNESDGENLYFTCDGCGSNYVPHGTVDWG